MSIELIENDISKYKVEKELGEALKRLLDNADYKAVIESAYLKDHLLFLVSQRHSNLIPDDQVSREIDSISCFLAFLNKVAITGATASISLQEAEQTLENGYREEY